MKGKGREGKEIETPSINSCVCSCTLGVLAFVGRGEEGRKWLGGE